MHSFSQSPKSWKQNPSVVEEGMALNGGGIPKLPSDLCKIVFRETISNLKRKVTLREHEFAHHFKFKCAELVML